MSGKPEDGSPDRRLAEVVAMTVEERVQRLERAVAEIAEKVGYRSGSELSALVQECHEPRDGERDREAPGRSTS